MVCGFHAAFAVLRARPGDVEVLFADVNRRDKRMTALLQGASQAGVEVQRLRKPELDALAQSPAHQGVVVRTQAASRRPAKELLAHLESVTHPPLVLVLDGVQDPHNLGACLRSASAAGVDAVVLPSAHSCGLTPAVARTACGAEHDLAVFYVTNLVRVLRQLQTAGLWIVGADQDGPAAIYEVELAGPLALVVGGEGRGIRPLVARCCDVTANIPMHGSVSSLNVSVAVGVVLFEAVRRRRTG